MEISDKAIFELKEALNKSYGEGFSDKFTDTELQELGMLFLTILAEGLKIRANRKIIDTSYLK